MKSNYTLAVLFLLTFSIDAANASTLINGANQTGIVLTNTVADSYTFTANAGDNINLGLGTTNFPGRLQLYGPNAALLDAVGAYPINDDLIAYTATNSGTFTVLVSSAVAGGSGTYELHLAQVPEAFIVPVGDEGGAMTNGGNYDGTITLGDLDMFTFTANAGNSINLRLGTTNFVGKLQLYGPNGALLYSVGAYPIKDDLINYTATNSGTFTVLVSDGYGGGTGTYELHLSQIPGAFIVPVGDQGGAMTNGGNYDGTITLGDLDMFTFTANAGNSINLRLGTTNFVGKLQLYGPNGALLYSVGAYPIKDDLINYTATNSGTFTVLVSDGYGGGTGTYELHLSQIPGAFIVPVGDQGGAMTNGGNYDGTITLGDLDMFTFTANAGSSINLRLGTTNFIGSLQLYGPNGALLYSVGAYPIKDDLINYTATNSGTFTVLVSDGYGGGTGTYELHLAQVPGAFIVPVGDQGGALTNGGQYDGTITLGDLDMYSCTACKGDVINLELKTTNFFGKLELYGPNGALLNSVGGYPLTDDILSYTATNCGTFTVLVSDGYGGGSGTYGLTANGISDALSLSPPVISGANLIVTVVGGTTNTSFVLYTATNITTPWGMWTPILTNHFDQFRAFHYTNAAYGAYQGEYFRFVVP